MHTQLCQIILLLCSILKNMTNSHYKRNIRLGFGISLIVLILSSAASYYSIQNLLDSEKWVNHTTKVISQLDYVLSKLKDAETGQRGYLLTNDTAFLQPYNGTREVVTATVDSVRGLTADNAEQQQDFPKLDSLIALKMKLVDQTINNTKAGIKVPLNDLLTGKGHMDEIRTLIKVMEGREQELMVSRTTRMNKYVSFTPILIVIASLISLVVTYIFFNKVKRDSEYSIELRERLIRKEQETQQQIEVIDKMAKRIAGGDYDARIDDSDLRP